MSGGDFAMAAGEGHIKPNGPAEEPGESSLLLEGTDAELIAGEREERSWWTKRRKRFGLLVVFWSWILMGCLFYISVDQGWNVIESVFFAVNIGLTLGYDNLDISGKAELFTVVYCLMGQAVMAAILLVEIGSFLEDASSHGRTTRHKLLMPWPFTAMCYAAWFFLGYGFSVLWMEYSVAKSVLWTLCALTGTGMINPTSNDVSYLFCIVYLTVGRPLHAYFWVIATRQIIPGKIRSNHVRLWMAITFVWFFGSILFYWLWDNSWDLPACMFFVVSTGFMIGFNIDGYTPHEYTFEIWYTVLFVLAGSTVVMSGLVLATKYFFMGMSKRAREAEARASKATKPMTWGAWFVSEWRPVLIAYWMWFYVGSEYAYTVYGYNTADSMNFATSVMATLGYTPPTSDDGKGFLFFTFYAIVGVPLGYTTWSMVFSKWMRPPRVRNGWALANDEDDAFDALRL